MESANTPEVREALKTITDLRLAEALNATDNPYGDAGAAWTPLTALPGARREPAPREEDLRKRLQAYHLKRLRETSRANCE